MCGAKFLLLGSISVAPHYALLVLLAASLVMRRLTVFIPSLFRSELPIHPDILPDLPALNWFLTRGFYQETPKHPLSYTLCSLFGLSLKGDSDLPIAAISRLSDEAQTPQGRWLRADPVHISAHREGLVLFDNNRFNLSQSDALTLAADLQPLLRVYGLSLEIPVAYRWYLKVENDYKLKTTPIDAIVGKNILPFMPVGDERINMRQLMNDIQMTLHTSAVNQKREQAKMLPINSVWFWGYGALPKTIEHPWTSIMSDETLARGLSILTATRFNELPVHYNDIKQSTSNYNSLIVVNALQKYSDYHDLEGWLKALIEYEANWFAPLFEDFGNNAFDQLTIKTESSTINVNNYSRYQIWKKKKTLYSYKD